MILGAAGGMMLMAPIGNPLDTGTPSDIPASTITKPIVTSADIQTTLLGLWEYGKARNPMWLIAGTPEQIVSEVQRTQNGAAAHARGECPELP